MGGGTRTSKRTQACVRECRASSPGRLRSPCAVDCRLLCIPAAQRRTRWMCFAKKCQRRILSICILTWAVLRRWTNFLKDGLRDTLALLVPYHTKILPRKVVLQTSHGHCRSAGFCSRPTGPTWRLDPIVARSRTQGTYHSSQKL